MRAIITRNPKFSGTCFDAFEYFYKAWELDKSIKLISLYPQITKQFLRKKYNFDAKCFNNIIFDDPYNYEYDKFLFFDTHCFDVKELRYKSGIVIANSEIIYPDNVQTFSEFFGPKNYTHKVYYQIQKRYPHERNTYVICQEPNNIAVVKILRDLGSYILKDSKSHLKHFSETKFTPDFFKHFNHLIYIKTPLSFDRHPRIFTEAEWQGIQCEYVNLTQELDPSHFRFVDRADLAKRSIEDDVALSELLK